MRNLIASLFVALLSLHAQAKAGDVQGADKGMGFEAETELTPYTPAQEQGMRAIALKRAPKDLAAADEAVTDEEKFYALPGAAMAAWHMKKYELAKSLAEQALALAPGFRANWSFGNAINVSHNVLGLVALHDGQTAEAVVQLHQAGETPGSPQLNSFGPSMQLAKALAQQGDLQAAIDYIEQCRVFWKMGKVWLDLWEQKLQSGEVPNFFANGYR